MSLHQYGSFTGREINNQACVLTVPLSVVALAEIVGATRLVGAGAEAIVSRVCIDSRAAAAQTVFVALRGERVDGHRFLGDVARDGCIAAMVSQTFWESQSSDFQISGLCLIVVADPLAALQSWAAESLRRRSGLLRVGVTGSNGKTTTKDLAHRIVATTKRAFVSPGNLNSVIGLPLAALAVPEDTEVAIFEMAMSEAGEMGRLAHIVFPGFAIITNIGTAHIGNIGSQEGIALEKKQIFTTFSGVEHAFIPGGDDFAALLASDVRGTVHYFGESCSPGYQGWTACEHGQIIHWRDQSIHLRAAGRHIRSDALAAIGLAEVLGYAAPDIRRGLEAWEPSFGRNEMRRGRVNLVLDCYNANPDSMAASLEAFVELPRGTGRRVAVLGDMRELGAYSSRAHAELGELVARLDLDLVLFFGAEMERAWQAWQATAGVAGEGRPACRGEHHPGFDGLAQAAERLIAPGDLVLLKASRGMELERLMPVIMEPVSQSGN